VSAATASRRVESVSLGCRLNLVEAEEMARAARATAGADLVIVNTCAVTAEAARQSRQTVRRLRRERPGAEIAVTGCAAHLDPEGFSALGAARVDAPFTGPQPALAASDGTRGMIAVQNGCDHRCAFCVIPFGRGPSRSAPPQEIVAQGRRLVEAGKREIVLTGVDLTSYGAGLDGGWTLGRLVRLLLRELPELERLRLSSIDCVEADGDLLAAMAEEERFAPHLHLSLQAGDDLILKRMKRRHSRADAVDFCKSLRAARPDIVFGADFIAGFPTESEEMFLRTLDLVEDCGLTYLHVFPFSARPGTPAARMPQVASHVAKERAARLRAQGEAALARHLAAQVGKRLRLLVERGGLARAADFTLARAPWATPGETIDAVAISHDGRALIVRPALSPPGETG
jgi:threonylcarbamoyladenosine tRNA methylthiotransferase MtaB